jgi:DNA-binding HxlR family transcriptional regulator
MRVGVGRLSITDLLYASNIEARRYHFGNRSASGRAVRGSRTGRPIMAALDLLGRRWTLRVLWELRDGSPASFRELRDRCDQMSTSVLNQRLAELREAGIVETGAGGYKLTPRGAELLQALTPLDAWAKRWRASGPTS